jgi:hypothetical protein
MLIAEVVACAAPELVAVSISDIFIVEPPISMFLS